MRALTIRQKIISASKESDSGIKYDASSVQSLFLHAVETGLADETIRPKLRPLTQNPKVADEDLIEAMRLLQKLSEVISSILPARGNLCQP